MALKKKMTPVYIPSGELANKIYEAIEKSGRLKEVHVDGGVLEQLAELTA